MAAIEAEIETCIVREFRQAQPRQAHMGAAGFEEVGHRDPLTSDNSTNLSFRTHVARAGTQKLGSLVPRLPGSRSSRLRRCGENDSNDEHRQTVALQRPYTRNGIRTYCAPSSLASRTRAGEAASLNSIRVSSLSIWPATSSRYLALKPISMASALAS